MSKAIFLTGTGTDIGKTFIAGLIVKKLAGAGKNPAYYKAAMSGNDRRPDFCTPALLREPPCAEDR